MESAFPSNLWMLRHYGGGSVGGGNIPMPLEMLPMIVARLKVIANLDVAEQRAPQQGNTTIRHREREYALRVSTEPVELGEKLTLRLELQGAT